MQQIRNERRNIMVVHAGPRGAEPAVEERAPIARKLEREIEEAAIRRPGRELYFWALLRLGLGWIFLWAFIDKLFGLGFATKSEAAWINGGSPTFGFLKFGTSGPFADFYSGMAGSAVIDWLFMLGMVAIGLPLLLGIGVRVAAGIGVLMATLMYTAGFLPPENNPFMDEHVMYVLIFLGLMFTRSGLALGTGRLWARIGLVRRYPVLM
jgi:thiosulfate dehydrogenase [quinone] large subunit